VAEGHGHPLVGITAPNCTTTIISLEPCALNAELQHLILRFNKKNVKCKINKILN